MLLNGTADQKRRLLREYLTGESEASSGDEFQKEMEAELSTTLKTLETTWGPLAAGTTHTTHHTLHTTLLAAGTTRSIYTTHTVHYTTHTTHLGSAGCRYAIHYTLHTHTLL